MPAAAMMFVHNPMTDAYCVNESTARELVAELEKLKEPMISAYANKTGKSRAEIIALMDGVDGHGTWLTAQEAIAFGLCDSYTPNNKLSLEAAAMLSPGVYAYRGHKMDMSKLPDIDNKLSGIIYTNRRVGPMAFWNKKKDAATLPKAAISYLEMVCPGCSGPVNLNPATSEVYAAGSSEAILMRGVPPALAASIARVVPSNNIRASVYQVDCPHCQLVFCWDTDIQGAEAKGVLLSGQASTDTVAAHKGLSPGAVLAQASCPSCGAMKQYDTVTAQRGIDAAGTEGYLLSCMSCGTQYVEPLVAASDAIPVATASVTEAYLAGVNAERTRMLALDEMLLASPGSAAMIHAAKKSGATSDVTAHNIIKALASSGGARQANFQAALNRDIAASGINTMLLPRHAALPKTDKEAAYDKTIADYNNQMMGGGE
jgi:hypothetical protein